MRIICDAPGQTCNRLWTYVATAARCIAEKKKMMIVFFDWTVEDFPNLLNCKFIYFPLYHKCFLKTKKGWGRYKQLTWTVTHNKVWSSIFKFLGFIKGWDTRQDTRYLRQTMPQLKILFRPKEEIMQKAESMIASLREQYNIVVGVHIRRGDYATWHNGRFFYDLNDYHNFMLKVQDLHPNKRIVFFISSNENFSTDVFEGCICRRFGKEPSGAILDLYTLSLCDLIMGPFSSYSRWASFIGEVPLCFIESKEQQFTKESFSKITDFFHFENGAVIYDW